LRCGAENEIDQFGNSSSIRSAAGPELPAPWRRLGWFRCWLVAAARRDARNRHARPVW